MLTRRMPNRYNKAGITTNVRKGVADMNTGDAMLITSPPKQTNVEKDESAPEVAESKAEQ